MYKVKCVLLEFYNDETKHPCHFNYKVGDVIYYDGDNFTGRICPSLLPAMMPIVHGVYLLGHKFTESVAYRYRGADERDSDMEKYDGVGFRPVGPLEDPATVGRKPGKYAANSPDGRSRGHHFFCGDQRTLAHFSCVPDDLSDSVYSQPFYRRAISILEKIEAEPGIKTDEILDRFTDFEKNDIAPRLTPVFVGVLLGALEDMDYIETVNGKVTATGREPPSRPKLGV